MAELQRGQNFYMLLGGASATLAGLMFIAISLGGTRRPTADERSTIQLAYSAFLSPTYIHFVYVLVTAAVVFVPTLNETVCISTPGSGCFERRPVFGRGDTRWTRSLRRASC